ncbi:transposase [Streptomyces sp. NPDC051364]|uniref:transposase n=1 Tax=Streptomyces sp. NPDC051364 TaxID=3155799 RepID=UPI0034360154
MGTSKYSPEFRADAVALYRARPGGSYSSVAKDLGINHGALTQGRVVNVFAGHARGVGVHAVAA